MQFDLIRSLQGPAQDQTIAGYTGGTTTIDRQTTFVTLPHVHETKFGGHFQTHVCLFGDHHLGLWIGIFYVVVKSAKHSAAGRNLHWNLPLQEVTRLSHISSETKGDLRPLNMGKFSIRRHKRELSDSATIITVEPSMSPSQRSLYGSIISNRPRNRLQKPQHDPPSPPGENRDAPNDTTKRPQRKLLKKFRLPHHQRTRSSEERTGMAPPEQKPLSSSLPTSPDRVVGLSGRRYANRNWSDNDIRPPSRFLYASPRGSVGSSADILLTPIRGSTAISDEDFVFLPGHDQDEIMHLQSERAESPGPTIQTQPTRPDSELHLHPVLLEPIVIEPTYTPHREPLPCSEYSPFPLKLEPLPVPEPEPEPEEPLTPMSPSPTSETQTITNAVVEVSSKESDEIPAVLLAAQAQAAIRESPSLVTQVITPTPSREPKISFQEATPYCPATKSPSPLDKPLTIVTKLPSQRNIIPFPSDLESARTPTLPQIPVPTIIVKPSEPYSSAGIGLNLTSHVFSRGARNGFVYGVKIRFPHALLMAILFGRGDWSQRARAIFKATKQHATNLAKFVTIYKTLLLIQRRANGGKEKGLDSFLAGLIGGYVVFGDRTAINEQIVLYVCSRVVASFIPRAFPSPPTRS
ncbi:hypothetical protein OPQ81_006423 [Rhizoctonia solani]|nr:hypothetical protein OPQ81_006423 [Rhizoctonia solani]